ncbi:MAG: hypothetical protein RIS35_2705 [Pseudomonadota bacterium]|jgi:high-affinity nickel-transport protein
MELLPADWFSLCALALLLGMRHGLDADHLATIDGLTRFHRATPERSTRWLGTLFSLGHGAVVLAVAAVVGASSTQWTPPEWLEFSGSLISIAFLLALGVVNWHAVLSAGPGQVVIAAGLRSRWLERFTRARTPWGVAAVGALFALSFDTVSHAALFAATATRFGGLGSALAIAGLFVAGMVITDGLNGWWISRLVARSDRIASIASRTLGAVIASLSLVVAGLGIARWASPAFEAWTEGRELAFGLTATGVVGAGYLVALGLARGQRAAAQVRSG